MRQRISALIILFNCLLIESKYVLPLSLRVDISFLYYPAIYPMSTPTIVRTREVFKRDSNNTFVLMGHVKNEVTLVVTKVNCTHFGKSVEPCSKNFQSIFILLFLNLYLYIFFVKVHIYFLNI
jgi:hypothetical protein